MMNDILIVIPARYASSRLPGKPLLKIAGVEMITRVARVAEYVCRKNKNCQYTVATDDVRIADFCVENEINVTMTPESCQSGTERCWSVVSQSDSKPALIINLQGDNPLCPPWIIQELIDQWQSVEADLYTPCVLLDWGEYDRMVEAKKETPYSGTTVLVDKDNYALAFSKTIIPAIRKPEQAKQKMIHSPVRRHIGLYAYTLATLEGYFTSERTVYEESYIEGLEQMRFLYNGLRVKMVDVDYRGRETTSGVDSPQDIDRVEQILAKYGEFDLE